MYVLWRCSVVPFVSANSILQYYLIRRPNSYQLANILGTSRFVSIIIVYQKANKLSLRNKITVRYRLLVVLTLRKLHIQYVHIAAWSPIEQNVVSKYRRQDLECLKVDCLGFRFCIAKREKLLLLLLLLLLWECHKPNPFKIIPLHSTRKENNWENEETLARAAVTVETERVKWPNPWCLW
jgi:hypothetical protein